MTAPQDPGPPPCLCNQHRSLAVPHTWAIRVSVSLHVQPCKTQAIKARSRSLGCTLPHNVIPEDQKKVRLDCGHLLPQGISNSYCSELPPQGRAQGRAVVHRQGQGLVLGLQNQAHSPGPARRTTEAQSTQGHTAGSQGNEAAALPPTRLSASWKGKRKGPLSQQEGPSHGRGLQDHSRVLSASPLSCGTPQLPVRWVPPLNPLQMGTLGAKTLSSFPRSPSWGHCDL